MDELNLDKLIERTWNDLKGEVSDSQIREVVMALTDKYQDAKVKQYIPIIIRQETVKQLKANLALTPHKKNN